MKKFLSVCFSLIMIVSCLFAVPVSASAAENTKQTAYVTVLDQVSYATLDMRDTTVWFSFIAPYSGYFNFEDLNPTLASNDGHTFITVYNSYGDEIGFEGVDTFTGRCLCAVNCNQGEAYYIEISDYGYLYDEHLYDEGFTYSKSFGFSVTAHNHDYNIQDYSYITYYTCRICGYQYQIEKVKPAPVKNTKTTKISKLTKGKKQFKATWKKASDVTGYQIQYSTDKKFKKDAKSVTVKKNTTTSVTVKKLKSKKKYYVRVRTYKTVNGKKVYSSWSAAKTVTTK